jgi:TonB dependent receptor
MPAKQHAGASRDGERRRAAPSRRAAGPGGHWRRSISCCKLSSQERRNPHNVLGVWAPEAAGECFFGTQHRQRFGLADGCGYAIDERNRELAYAINAHYQSATTSALSASIPTVAGYTMVDTRLSFALPHWVLTAYVDNVTDILGITAYQDPAVFGNRYMAIVSQPRSVGLKLAYSFKDK